MGAPIILKQKLARKLSSKPWDQMWQSIGMIPAKSETKKTYKAVISKNSLAYFIDNIYIYRGYEGFA